MTNPPTLVDAPTLSKLPQTLDIPTADLCAYYLYYKKQPGSPGYSSHDDVAARWSEALVEFQGQVEFANSTLRLIQDVQLNTGTIERIGEAIGLAVASKIHGLHQADWRRIPKTNFKKTLDFGHLMTASDGKHFIQVEGQVETKGSVGKNNALKSSSVSQQKASIKAKIDDASDAERTSSVLYGTIAVLDDRLDSVARCLLVDPPPNVPDNAERFKTVTRLAYIANLISLISPRSTIASALRTRISALDSMEDIEQLNGNTLKKGNGEEFSTQTFEDRGVRNPFFQAKSVVTDDAVGGHVFAVAKTWLLFVGIQEKLVVYASEQAFPEIQKYAFDAQSIEKSVTCAISVGQFKRKFASLLKLPKAETLESGGYVVFTLTGRLYYSRSGLVIGVLPIPEETRKP